MGVTLTICTATYNREMLLKKLFESLKGQSVLSFEWLIMDDNSTDQTNEMVQKWINETKEFVIRYYKLPHGGKHRALNRAFELANGKWFLIVDSDDYLLPDAVEYIKLWIAEVQDKPNIAGVSGMRCNSSGNIWGSSAGLMNGEWIEASNLERERYCLGGDKAEVYRTSILRQFPFPEFAGEYFVTEAVCWDAIARSGYVVRWYNIPICVTEYLESGLTKTGANSSKGHIANYNGYCYWIAQSIKYKSIKEMHRSFAKFCIIGLAMHKTFWQSASDIGLTPGGYLCKMIYTLFLCVPESIRNKLKKMEKL